MIIYQVLNYTVITILIICLLALITTDNARYFKDEFIILPASKIFLYLGISVTTIGLYLLLLPWTLSDEEDWWFMLKVCSVMGLCILLLGTFLLLTYRHHQLSFNNKEFWVTNFRGKVSTTYSWKTLKEVRWNLLSGQIILLLKNGQKVKFTQYLGGLAIFVDAIEHHTELKVEKFREYLNKFNNGILYND